MKKLFFALTLTIAIVFTACGGSSRDQLFKDYDTLIEKTVELTKKAKQGDDNALTELDTITEEAAKLQEKHRDVIDNLSAEDKKMMDEKMTKLMGAMM